MVPRHAKLVMVDAQFDLPLLQRLLLGGEVVNISIGCVIGLTEHGVLVSADDPHRQIIQLGVIVAHDSPCPENMVVVLAVVESHQILIEQCHNVLPRRIDPCLDDVRIALHKADHEEVREDLDVKEGENISVLRITSLRNIIGLEFHLVHQNDAIIRPMRRPQSEIKYLITHVGDVVWFTGLIHLVHELLDELDARLGPRTTLLAQSLLDDVA